MMTSRYDDWKLAGPGERRSDGRHSGVCQTCQRDIFGKEARDKQCPGCGHWMCADCRNAVKCECGKVFCDRCVSTRDGMWLCRECLAEHFRGLAEFDRHEAVRRIHSTPAVNEKHLIGIGWALQRIYESGFFEGRR